MAFLFFLGAVFYQERALFCDGVYYLFTIVNDQKFAIMHERYGIVAVELWTYLAQKLHLPLKAVIFLFGMSFYFTYFIAHLFIVYALRQYRLGIIMALFYTMLVSQSFFFMSEVPVGGMWMFLLLAVTRYMGQKQRSVWLLLPVFIPLAFFAFTSHFTILIPTVFLWVYFILEKTYWPWSRRHTILLTVAMFATFGGKFVYTYFVGDNTGYDTNNLKGVTHASLRDVVLFFKTHVVRLFIQRALSMYWISTFACILGIAALIRQHAKTLAVWSLLSILGYCVLVGLAFGYYDDSFMLFHVECEWMCLGAIMATPFVCAWLEYPGHGRQALAMLSILFAVRIAYICMIVPVLHRPVAFQHDVYEKMKQKNIRKLALYRNRDLMDINLLDWGATYASIMWSQADGEKPQRFFTFIDSGSAKEEARLQNARGMDIFWTDLDSNSLNKHYFYVDTTHYMIMSYNQFLNYPSKPAGNGQ